MKLLQMLAVASLFPLMAIQAHGAGLPPVQELMSAEEMAVTGVEKLSPEELQALREWLEIFVDRDAAFIVKEYRERMEAEAEARAAAGQPAGQPEKDTRNRFDKSMARIVGEFRGWEGKTLFTLDNGEVWQQRRDSSIRRTRPIQNPEVQIKKNMFGFYEMEVFEADIRVPVTRVR